MLTVRPNFRWHYRIFITNQGYLLRFWVYIDINNHYILGFLYGKGDSGGGTTATMVLNEIKERVKKTKDEKKAKKAEVQAKLQKSQGKGAVSKGAAPKGPKLGGGGGKR
ncbi:uncharacterized protein HKW66_Vig0183860 [Vigna angularis]|uniref:Uncharacterized protein n=1 Tax=Phaseolus angularis TaxID=3914 RepID=A0A8T0KS87_PHAAN|nr:uncharacterized protein HKW66_Vig0183860 [Vigna angularis]